MINRNFNKILLTAILILAGFLRLWNITNVPVSLFGDELDVGYHAYSILKTGKDYMGNPWPIHFHSIAEWRTPIYLYSSVPTVALFGITPLGVRLPAAIFGVLGVFGIYLVVKELLTYQASVVKKHPRALFAAFLLAISPWHIQYSRAGFEVTELIAFLLFALFFFFRALRLKGKGLWMSVALFCFTPWIYSTAKLFTPLFLILLFFMWKKDILNFPMRRKLRSIIVGLVVGLPIAYSTFYGGGTERASYISVFTDPTIESEVGTNRLSDLMVKGEAILGSTPSFWDRFFHNKIVIWTNDISRNYFESLSSDFLFNKGDPNLRHSVQNMGEFFKIDSVLLLLGLILFLTNNGINIKIKSLILVWIILGILPAAVTRDGGTHATRLILILPPLIFLMSYGLIEALKLFKPNIKYLLVTAYILLLATNFTFYLHNYYMHWPWSSERWWHSGFQEAIQSIKVIDKDYDKVIISMAGEPAWIFFSAWYQYPPDKWQKNFPIGNDVNLLGFGKISHIDKYYFGNFNIAGGSLYDLGKYIDNKTLYLAVAKELPPNLIMDPERTPSDLRLIKAISYPSGEPAYYLLTKK